MPDQPTSVPVPRRVLIAATVFAIALVAGVVVLGVRQESLPGAAPTTAPPSSPPATGPVAVVPVDAPQAGSADCAKVLSALPASVRSGSNTLRRKDLLHPAPAGAAAWRGDSGDPVVLRCGLPTPPELTPTSELIDVSGVQWLQVKGTDATTWFAVDRPVVVALTLPDGSGSGPLQTVSGVLTATLAAVTVHPS